MIHHQEVRGKKAFAGLLIKTEYILAACFLGADMRLAANLRPNFWIGLNRQIAQRTVARCARPFRKPGQFALFRAGENLVCLLQGAFEASRAKIILPALHERRFKFNRQNFFQDRNIFVKQLLLEIDGVRRDIGIFVVLERE